jgi:uncharacterized phage-associated protein
MIAYKTEKINNAICFFAKEVYKLRKQYLPQTLLYKFLSYLDFSSIEKLGKPALELEYRAYKNGPVPVGIYNHREGYQSDCFKFEKRGTDKFVIISTKEADLDYFSEFEIEIMNYLLDKYIKNNLSMKKIIDNICEDSHNEIRAWKVAYDRKKNSAIDYSDTFEELDKKEDDKLSMQEERFLVYRGLKNNILCN